jgi:integrase
MTTERVPTYRCQKQHNGTLRAFVELEGQRHYLGLYDDPASEQKYHRLIAEWLANGRQSRTAPEKVTITAACTRWYQHVEQTYQAPTTYKPALRALRRLYGDIAAVDFGPLAFKTVIAEMVKQGWSRKYVNKNLHRIKRMVKWAKNEQMIPGSVYDAIRDIDGLKMGQTTARETEPVTPVPQEWVDAIEPYTSRQVWAMVQLQLLTGARPGEVARMRPADINKSGSIWICRFDRHKTAYLGRPREIFIGSRAQKVLQPFLRRPVDSYLFSPEEANRERKMAMRLRRQTTVQPSQVDRRKEKPRKKSGIRYTTSSYARAISYAIKAAFRPAGMTTAEFRTWTLPQHWHPNQLRHNAATFIRQKYGLEEASIILGHRKADVTQIYAERDRKKALEVIAKVG